MRLTLDWSPSRFPVHCCLFDRECLRMYRDYYAPLRLYLHFLKDKDGHVVWVDLWGSRRHDRWLTELLAKAPMEDQPRLLPID